MAFQTAKTNLGVIEDKLRKFFNLAGTIGASFAPTITPVYVVGDARDPGVANFKGRKWAYGSDLLSTPLVAGDSFVLTWAVPVVLSGIQFLASPTAFTTCEAFYLAPDDAAIATLGANRIAGTWADQKALTSDFPPLLDKAAKTNVAVTNKHQKRIASWSFGNTVTADNQRIPLAMHSPAGGALAITVIGTSSGFYWNVWGEIAQP